MNEVPRDKNSDERLMNGTRALETHLCEFEYRKCFGGPFFENPAEHRVDLGVETCVAESEKEGAEEGKPGQWWIDVGCDYVARKVKNELINLTTGGRSSNATLTYFLCVAQIGIVRQIQKDQKESDDMNSEAKNDNRVAANFVCYSIPH